jgi:hypothetical protein
MGATTTFHVIATLDFLDPGSTFWAFLESKSLDLPLPLHGIMLKASFIAAHALVRFFATSRTYRGETRWTLQRFLFCLALIDLLAVGCRTVLVLLDMLFQVACKHGVDELLECLVGHESPNERNGNGGIACSFVPYTHKRERLGVGC